MLISCEFESVKFAVAFETMLSFSTMLRDSEGFTQDTFACDVSRNNFGLLNEFFKIRNPLKKCGFVPAANYCILLLYLILDTFCPYRFKPFKASSVPLMKRKSKLS